MHIIKNYHRFRYHKKRPTALAVCQPLPNKVPHKVQDKVQDKFPEVSQSTWDVLVCDFVVFHSSCDSNIGGVYRRDSLNEAFR